jgi:VWFA-related protein
MIRSLTYLLVGLFVSGPVAAYRATAQAQQTKTEQNEVRLKADLVQVRAVVTDKRGQPVSDLKKEDFELLEDNRPQEISFFSFENIGRRTESPSPESLRATRDPAQNVDRTIAFFVDTIHTTFASLASTKHALRRFVDEQMSGRDRVALITSSGALGLMEQFTGNRQLIRAAIERLTPWRLSQEETLFTPYLAAQIIRGDKRSILLGVEIVRTEEILPRETPGQVLEARVRTKASQILAEASYRRTVTLSTLKGIVERVAEMPGQRMVVVFSEGFTLLGTAGGSETEDLQPAITRAVRSGAVIYSIAAQGLQPVMLPPSVAVVPSPRRPRDVLQLEMADLTSTLGASERDLQFGLSQLAKDTGGEAFYNTNDLNGRLQKALNDNRVYYALAYHASNQTLSGRDKPFRVITLRVKNHPEYKVRTQRGYQPLEAKLDLEAVTPRQKLAQAMSAQLPVTGIPVAVSADYFERESLAGQAYVQIFIDASTLRYRLQDEKHYFELEAVITIYDLTGKRVHISTNVANGSFTAERLELAKRNGYRYTERVALKPGIYQARIGILEPGTERIGTATGWLEVPDLTKGQLTLSAILLTREQSSSRPQMNNASEGESLSPAVTQGIMIYNPGADLDYHLVIHPGKDLKADDLMMQVEVAQSDRLVFQGQWVSAGPRIVERDNKGAEVAGSLTLNGIKPGLYELRLAVKHPGSKKPVQRTVSFGIEP